MGSDRKEFLPDWTLRPGVALQELLEHRGMTEAGLAASAMLGPETVAGVLSGTTAVDGPIAERIGDATGTSAQFWLNYQANYEADMARGAKDVSDDD